MATRSAPEIWRLQHRQQGTVTRRQLEARGFTRGWIRHRVRIGRLHEIWPGVYAVGRPELSRRGYLLGAVLSCGDGAALSHSGAAEDLALRPTGSVEVSVPRSRHPRRRGMIVHRRETFEVAMHAGIPVTSPTQTLVDIAPRLTEQQLERAVNQADKLDLVHPEQLYRALDRFPATAGVRVLRELLDKQTFTLNDSDLEALFVPLAMEAGLPLPLTKTWVNGFEVDFYWPELGLVVETDGGRFHRTAAEQTRDRLRDQTHFAAGLQPLRFTHWQVVHDRAHVRRILRAAVGR